MLAAASCVFAQNSPVRNRTAIAASAHTNPAASSTKTAAHALLPPAFAGLPRQGDVVVDPTPDTLDAVHAAVLKEDGMVEAAVGHYSSIAHPGYVLQAIRFEDATGAFAAFTFFRTPGMRAEPLGDQADAGPGAFLVRRGALLLVVRPLSGSTLNPGRLAPEVKPVVAALPRTYGPSAIPPPLPELLPKQGLDATSLHYAVGPAGYHGPLPASALGFSADAEVATATYHLPGSPPAILTLDMLPTNELAEQALDAIRALPDADLHVSARRLGTMVAVVSGKGIAAGAAGPLLAKVHYTPAVTLDIAQSKGPNEVAKTAQLLIVVAEFTGILAVAAVLLAASFGFGRVWLRRLRGKPDSSLHDEQFITLKLK